MGIIERLDQLEEVTDAAAAEWDSRVPTPTLRQFHTATDPATVKELILALRQARSDAAGLDRRLGEADTAIARVEAVVKNTPVLLASTSPTNGWIRANLVQLALEGLLSVEALVELAGRSVPPEATGKVPS